MDKARERVYAWALVVAVVVALLVHCVLPTIGYDAPPANATSTNR
jgi:hypothetical protein